MEFLRRTRNVEESWLRTRLVKCSFKNRNFRNSTRKLTNSIWSSRQIVRTPISNRTSRKKLSRKRGCFRAGRFFPLTWQQTNKQGARLRARSGHAAHVLLLNFKSQTLCRTKGLSVAASRVVAASLNKSSLELSSVLFFLTSFFSSPWIVSRFWGESTSSTRGSY